MKKTPFAILPSLCNFKHFGKLRMFLGPYKWLNYILFQKFAHCLLSLYQSQRQLAIGIDVPLNVLSGTIQNFLDSPATDMPNLFNHPTPLICSMSKETASSYLCDKFYSVQKLMIHSSGELCCHTPLSWATFRSGE